jgi:hypothetical protein
MYAYTIIRIFTFYGVYFSELLILLFLFVDILETWDRLPFCGSVLLLVFSKRGGIRGGLCRLLRA